MKAYGAIFRIRFIHGFQYRIVVFSHLFTGFLWGWMLVLGYMAFYRGNPAAFPMTLSQTVTYMWLQQTFLILFSVVFEDLEIETSIQTGSITYELVRPAGLYGRWFVRTCAGRVLHTVYRLPLLIVVFLLPAPFRMSPPADALSLALFLPSAALGLGVACSLALLMYITMFYTTSYGGVRVMVIAMTSFLSGGVIPLPFFPEPVRAVLERLPFAATQNIPLRIYTGNIAGIDALTEMGFQLLWLGVLAAVGGFAMSRALRRVITQGG